MAVSVWIVLAINGVLSVALWAIALILWRLRTTLAQVTASLEATERGTHGVLGNAPEAIAIGQTSIAQLRQNLRDLGPGFEPLRRWLNVASLALSLWQRQSRRGRR